MGCVGEWASGQVVDLAGSGGSEELPSARARMAHQRSGITSGRFRSNQGPRISHELDLHRALECPPPAPSLLVKVAAECAVQRGLHAVQRYGTARTLGQMFTHNS